MPQPKLLLKLGHGLVCKYLSMKPMDVICDPCPNYRQDISKTMPRIALHTATTFFLSQTYPWRYHSACVLEQMRHIRMHMHAKINYAQLTCTPFFRADNLRGFAPNGRLSAAKNRIRCTCICIVINWSEPKPSTSLSELSKIYIIIEKWNIHYITLIGDMHEWHKISHMRIMASSNHWHLKWLFSKAPSANTVFLKALINVALYFKRSCMCGNEQSTLWNLIVA